MVFDMSRIPPWLSLSRERPFESLEASCKLSPKVKTTVPDSDIDKLKHLDVQQRGWRLLTV